MKEWKIILLLFYRRVGILGGTQAPTDDHKEIYMALNVETHQVEGFDSVPRSFNRNIEISKSERGYHGKMHYEDFTIESENFKTIRETIRHVISLLQQKGFKKLRTRLTFRGKKYLGERGIRHFEDSEAWNDYPDINEEQ